MSEETPAPPPPLAHDDVKTAIRVLRSLVADRALLVAVPKDDMKELLQAAGIFSLPTRKDLRKQQRALRHARREEMEKKDTEATNGTALRQQRLQATKVAPTPLLLTAPDRPVTERATPRACYVCKTDFTRMHFFYDSMCTNCGDFNFQKRTQTADLSGRVALVTGARVKIGFQTALMMLRAGCTVVAATRFPKDAARRYSQEVDFPVWKDRLQVHGLDLRHIPSVEVLANHLLSTLPRLDFLINNAAQTVRRPPQFYAHLIPGESAPGSSLTPEQRLLLSGHDALVRQLSPQAALTSGAMDTEQALMPLGLGRSSAATMGLWGSAQLSQVPYNHDDSAYAQELFPQGHVDIDQQQVDRRNNNSWRLKLADVPTPELVEVHLVNAFAPFILNSRLKPLMMREPVTRDRHIINVSAMEGIFSRGTKTDRHPHTNMAKASLNMMTRTSAGDYLKDGIHMNSVDTGWVTDEDPMPFAQRKEQDLNFQPPLDVVDGAARVLDPIFNSLVSGEHPSGKFFKDYRSAEW